MPDEDSKKGYDVPLIRLRESRTELSTDDLDEDEIKALAEVSKKGYYHARPKTEPAPAPRRIENPEALPSSSAAPIRKRTTFDQYQQKWDKFQKNEPAVKEVPKENTPAPPKKQKGRAGLWASLSRCCRRRR
mmetsp:Transcript_66972/g.155447  ORF Transcript_66972/g.155447 Transcript_66972/m.155447 type:complete len:132 (+) Transcript_66972:58-453(+)